ncbi:MAG: sucrase ferredoxin, partial [Nannocystaceae bacterium]|nr:sucrase ferredoxin [Nannocystaceae bacterium]
DVYKRQVLLGVEVRGVWPRNAFDCATVPETLRSRLPMWAAAVPGFRPQALRRPGREQCPEPAVFVALTGPACDVMVRLDVPSLDALCDVDLPTVVETIRAGGVPERGRRVEEPAVWVCVHGKRDRCCAKFGAPVYEAAAALDGVDAWQTSHLGGHRFAATLLCLPSGLCYGRLQASDVEPLARSHGLGRVHDLTLFRGRTCWSAPGQAAVHFVRAHLGEMAVVGFAPCSEAETEAGIRVRVESPRGAFDVVVEKRPVGGEASPSCDKPPAPVSGWFQVDLQSV